MVRFCTNFFYEQTSSHVVGTLFLLLQMEIMLFLFTVVIHTFVHPHYYMGYVELKYKLSKQLHLTVCKDILQHSVLFGLI